MGDFEVGSAEELRRMYGLYAENRPVLHLHTRAVPEALRHLIPLAELYGVSDDLMRADLRRKLPAALLGQLVQQIQAVDDALDEWLAGPEAQGPTFSPEYVAFTSLRMLADGC